MIKNNWVFRWFFVRSVRRFGTRASPSLLPLKLLIISLVVIDLRWTTPGFSIPYSHRRMGKWKKRRIIKNTFKFSLKMYLKLKYFCDFWYFLLVWVYGRNECTDYFRFKLKKLLKPALVSEFPIPFSHKHDKWKGKHEHKSNLLNPLDLKPKALQVICRNLVFY